jgi:hypothetical protein
MNDKIGLFESEPSREPSGRGATAAVVIVVALVVALAAVVFGGDGDGGDARPAAASGSTSPDPGGDGESASGQPAPAADACRQRYAAQRAPLRAAGASLAQWRIHVSAMNDLVAGRITLDQAAAFWDTTRVGAQRRLTRFAAAAATLEGLPRCHQRDTEVAGCADVVHARSRQLATADRTLATWQEHVRHMEMLRHGHLSPARATRMWLASWEEGVREIDAYDAAKAEAVDGDC